MHPSPNQGTGAPHGTRRHGRLLPDTHWVLLALGLLFLVPLACSDGPTGPGGERGSYTHDRAPGASAADLLSAGTFRHLVVQVQYVEGVEPSTQGLTQLRTFLEARLNKPGGIEIRLDPAPIAPATGGGYSTVAIRALEAKHRTLFTSGDTLAAYLLVVDGTFDGQPTVLGIAYNNTSTALFGAVIRQHTGGPLQPARSTVEATVARHEFGHLMGLVNNGSPMRTPHQDTANGRHCDDERCLMYFAVRTTGFLGNLMGGAIPSLDQNCLDDLRANGGR